MCMKKWHGKILICVILVLVTLVAFEGVRNNDFISYDDDTYITANPNVKSGISFLSILWAFKSWDVGNWHPLTWISHMLDFELFGLNPTGHHMMNVLLHVCNVLLLFWVLGQMTGTFWRSAIVAAIFAVHPLRVESVAWVAERKDVLSGFFFFMVLASYLRYTRRPSVLRFLPVFFLFAAGLMAKPMLVTAPIILLLLDYWPLHRFDDNKLVEAKDALNNQEATNASALRLIYEKGCLFILSAASMAVTFIAQQYYGAVAKMQDVPLGLRISNAVVSYVSYINKMVYPRHLALVYPFPRHISLWSTLIFSFLICVVTVGVFVLKRRRYLLVGWLWYLIMLLPVIGLVKVGDEAIADRYTYLPSIGLSIILVWLSAEFVNRLGFKRLISAVIIVLMINILVICTRIQVKHWANSKTLYEHTLAVTENNYKIHNNYGMELGREGNQEEAVVHFKEALRINPNLTQAHLNISKVFLAQNRYDDVIAHCKQALQIEPDEELAYYFLGRACIGKGFYDEAMTNLRQAERVAPNWPLSYAGLAQLYYEQGQIELAIKALDKAIELAVESRNNGLAEKLRRQRDAYKKTFKKATQ